MCRCLGATRSECVARWSIPGYTFLMATAGLHHLPDVFTHADALAADVPESTLYRWRDAGEVELLARGIYTRPGFSGDPDLTEIAIRAPRATICLTSALTRHGLTDEIPASIDVALPRRQRSPRTAAPVTWHRFEESTYLLGRTTTSVAEHVQLGVYNAERTICDAYRLRHLCGEEQANEALRRYLRQRGAQPSDLLAMARHFPAAEPALRRAMQILL